LGDLGGGGAGLVHFYSGKLLLLLLPALARPVVGLFAVKPSEERVIVLLRWRASCEEEGPFHVKERVLGFMKDPSTRSRMDHRPHVATGHWEGADIHLMTSCQISRPA
jgi:hypothetical protein